MSVSMKKRNYSSLSAFTVNNLQQSPHLHSQRKRFFLNALEPNSVFFSEIGELILGELILSLSQNLTFPPPPLPQRE